MFSTQSNKESKEAKINLDTYLASFAPLRLCVKLMAILEVLCYPDTGRHPFKEIIKVQCRLNAGFQ